MTISYELAKKLKDAGFPQFTFDTLNPLKGHWEYKGRKIIPGIDTLNLNDPDSVYIPTLSELMEACGDELVLDILLKIS